MARRRSTLRGRGVVRQWAIPPGGGGSTSPGAACHRSNPRGRGPLQISGPLWGGWSRNGPPPGVGGWPVAGAPSRGGGWSGNGPSPGEGGARQLRGSTSPGGGLSPEQPPGEGAPADKESPLGGWYSNGPPPGEGAPGSQGVPLPRGMARRRSTLRGRGAPAVKGLHFPGGRPVTGATPGGGGPGR